MSALYQDTYCKKYAISAIIYAKIAEKAMEEIQSRGYLKEKFRLFHLRDRTDLGEIDYHYHSFHKLLLFLGGRVRYVIEGRRYPLAAGDLVLVPRGCVHRPESDGQAPYSRYVLYLDAEYLRRPKESPLDRCFTEAEAGGSYILRLGAEQGLGIAEAFRELEAALGEREGYGSALLAELTLQRLMLEICRRSLGQEEQPAAQYDREIQEVLRIIGTELTEDLSAEKLAERFYVSKYHLMRRFREETGYTLHKYISGKRLLMARDLLIRGTAPTEACFGCGYRDYSAFARAYKKQFGTSPRSETDRRNGS